MSNEKSNSGDYERDERTIKLLRELREKLHSKNISTARLAAYQLSWRQEDGLMILKEALFGDYERTTKKASAYGMRSMKGRMLKLATETIEQGLKHRDKTTKAACIKCLALMKGEAPKKAPGGGGKRKVNNAKSSYKPKPKPKPKPDEINYNR
jgi:hypothetical protein